LFLLTFGLATVNHNDIKLTYHPQYRFMCQQF